MNRVTCLLLALLLSVSACRYPQAPAIQPEAAAQVEAIESLVAVASWYGHPYHGRRTSNGEVYDMDLLTAAHRTWPFHTLVRVTHLGNGRSVLVRINDRGPFVQGREIDLSREAARRLNMIDEGTARVRLEIVSAAASDGDPPPAEVLPPPVLTQPDPEPPSQFETGPRYRLQLGAFSSPKNARRLLDRLQSEADWLKTAIVEAAGLYRVQSVDCFVEAQGRQFRQRLLEIGLESILKVCDGGGG